MSSVLSRGLKALVFTALTSGTVLFTMTAQAEDAAKGAKLYQGRCKICHVMEAGKAPGIGPNLSGVFGRTSGTSEGYKYSPALQKAAVEWNKENLDKYLAAPGKFIPGGRMAAAVPNAADRADIIAYLATQSGP